MGCTSPLYRIPEGSTSFYALDHFDRKRVHNGGVFFFGADTFETLKNMPMINENDIQVIGCGLCDSCRLKYSRDWAIRCQLEAELHETNYFVTLTYDTQHLPVKECIDYVGNIYDSDLVPEHPQQFIKNYREWERTENGVTGLRVFYCGEYGSDEYTSRPHYHLILFGCSKIPDLRFLYRKNGFDYFTSPLLERFWSTGGSGSTCRGYVVVSQASFDSMAYTARYVMKKQKGPWKKDFMKYYNEVELDIPIRTQPFCRMSNRPGIARQYYEDHKFTIYEEDLVKYQKQYELYNAKPPRYFDKLFDVDAPELCAIIKDKRKRLGIETRKAKRLLYTETEPERLVREADMVRTKLRRLRRSLE